MLCVKIKSGQGFKLKAGESSIEFVLKKIPKENGKIEVVFHGPDHYFDINVIDALPGEFTVGEAKS